MKCAWTYSKDINLIGRDQDILISSGFIIAQSHLVSGGSTRTLWNHDRPGAAQHSASREPQLSPSHRESAAWKVAGYQEPGHRDSQKRSLSAKKEEIFFCRTCKDMKKDVACFLDVLWQKYKCVDVVIFLRYPLHQHKNDLYLNLDDCKCIRRSLLTSTHSSTH